MADRRMHILEAAGALFGARGFRAVTMEAAAEAAGVSKATLYKYFSDKDILFRAVADEFTDRTRRVVAAELLVPGTVDDRVARALVARHRMVFEAVDGSPHAHELMTAKERLAHNSVAVIDAGIMAALAAVLKEDPQFQDRSDIVARALFHGSVGIGQAAQSAAQCAHDVDEFVRTYLLGLRVQCGVEQRPNGEAERSPLHRKARQ